MMLQQINTLTARQPVFNLGFRPFFLLASVFATLFIPLWLAIFAGLWPAPTYLGFMGWHTHEMLFGYTMAVVAGFLLTAVSNWTGIITATGPLLAGLSVLWVVARVTLTLNVGIPAWLGAMIDVLFLPALAGVLFLPLWRSGNFRNLIFPALLLALAVANLVIHLQALGVLASGSIRAQQFALNTIMLIMVVIGGRVIPFFTTNVLPDAQVRRIDWADKAAIGLVMLVLVIDLFPFLHVLAGPAAILAAVVNIVRMWHWRFLATLRIPMLWILYAGYGWIIVALVLKGLASVVPWITPSAAIHALTVGAIGSLTLGIMSRVALAHTGRAIVASTVITGAFALINVSAILRVMVPIAIPVFYWSGLVVSGLLWAVAFALFLVYYTPILIQPRIDGKPG